jgi:hypothetical protein
MMGSHGIPAKHFFKTAVSDRVDSFCGFQVGQMVREVVRISIAVFQRGGHI